MYGEQVPETFQRQKAGDDDGDAAAADDDDDDVSDDVDDEGDDDDGDDDHANDHADHEVDFRGHAADTTWMATPTRMLMVRVRNGGQNEEAEDEALPARVMRSLLSRFSVRSKRGGRLHHRSSRTGPEWRFEKHRL